MDFEKCLFSIGKVLAGKWKVFRCDRCDKSYDFAILIERNNGLISVEHPDVPICPVCCYEVKEEETFLKGWADVLGLVKEKNGVQRTKVLEK